jgi:hypothetical protein
MEVSRRGVSREEDGVRDLVSARHCVKQHLRVGEPAGPHQALRMLRTGRAVCASVAMDRKEWVMNDCSI